MLRSVVDGVIDPQCPFEMVSTNVRAQPGVRWTESQSPRSDRLSSESIDAALRIFFESHRQGISVLSDPRTFVPLVKLTDSLRRNPPKRIIVGGAGSSGRVSVILSHMYKSQILEKGIEIVPWMVGGARAVKQTVENAEDNPHSLREFLESAERSPLCSDDLLIGISCGASAPSVAGALKFARESGARCALIANNPFSMAPGKDVDGLPGGMKGVLAVLSKDPSFFPLPALFGAEVLTGSTRLNGGTTSWLVLEAILSSFLSDKTRLASLQDLQRKTESNLMTVWTLTITQLCDSIPVFIEALKDSSSKISFIGDEVIGRVCVLDASEHPPTFGVPVGRVGAFLPGGWNSILGGFFERGEIQALEEEATTEGSFNSINPIQQGFQLEISSDSLSYSKFFPCSDPLSAKMILNTLTTISYAHAGFVDGNIMVNMIPSNIKLIERAIRVISTVVGTSQEDSEKALSQAILGEIPDTIDHDALAKKARRGALQEAINIARNGK